MRKFATPDRQPVVRKFCCDQMRKSWLLLMLLPVVLFALPAFADTTATDSGGADAGYMTDAVWQQDSNKLDDAELRKGRGKGVAFFIAQPELIPAVILWDESGKGLGAGTTRTSFPVNVSSSTVNTR